MLRIGIWFDDSHVSYGGPAAVLTGTIQGLLEDAEKTNRPIKILINQNGDVNWVVTKLREHDKLIRQIQNPVIGPIIFSHTDALTTRPGENIVWSTGKRFLLSSQWYADLVQKGLPMNPPRSITIWEAGVDTKFFVPSQAPKTQDFFIYFKSQKYDELQKIQQLLFTNYFKMTGTIITYYYYTPEMLREVAQKSRFCIFMSNTETQGLAALEILACDCPIIMLDVTEFEHELFRYKGATSATCWSPQCGIKTSLNNFNNDLKQFLANISSYKPRDFVCENYSYEKAAHKLRNILELTL
jgi:hypothetical protein